MQFEKYRLVLYRMIKLILSILIIFSVFALQVHESFANHDLDIKDAHSCEICRIAKVSDALGPVVSNVTLELIFSKLEVSYDHNEILISNKYVPSSSRGPPALS